MASHARKNSQHKFIDDNQSNNLRKIQTFRDSNQKMNRATTSRKNFDMPHTPSNKDLPSPFVKKLHNLAEQRE